MGQIHGPILGSPAAIVDEGGRLYTNSVLDRTRVRGSGLVMFPKRDDRLMSGRAFMWGDIGSVDTAGSLGILIPVGSCSLHICWTIRGNGDTDIEFFEDVAVSASGIVGSIFNMNRMSDITMNSKIFTDPTITDSGTKLFERYLLGGSGTDWRTAEVELGTSTNDFLLAAGSTYWLKLLNESERPIKLSPKFHLHEHG